MISQVIHIDEVADAIRELGPLFKDSSGIPGAFRADSFLMSWSMILDQGMGALFKLTIDEKIVGLLGAIIVLDIFDGRTLASEAFWFVHPDHRGSMGPIRLFKKFEEWAKEIGAERITTAHLDTAMSGKLEQFYENSGYHRVETLYRKELV